MRRHHEVGISSTEDPTSFQRRDVETRRRNDIKIMSTTKSDVVTTSIINLVESSKCDIVTTWILRRRSSAASLQCRVIEILTRR